MNETLLNNDYDIPSPPSSSPSSLPIPTRKRSLIPLKFISYSYISLFYIFLFPALGGYLFGYDIGATSFVLTQLTGSHSGVKWGGEDSTVDNSDILQGIIASAAVGGALIGSFIIFLIADQLGRRKELIYGAFLYMIGSILEYISADNDFDSSLGITILLIGRIIYGIGCGFSMHGAPAYIAEMAPSHIRGILISLMQGLINVGILMGYLIGYLFRHDNGGWKYTYGISSIIALFMLLGNYLLPPSVRWLFLNNHFREAKISLYFLYRNCEDTDRIFNEMFEDVEEYENRTIRLTNDMLSLSPPKNKRKKINNNILEENILYDSLNDNNNNNNNDNDDDNNLSPFLYFIIPTSLHFIFLDQYKKIIRIGLGLVFLQQVTGQPSILYYANTLFEDIGLDSSITLGVALVLLLASIFSTLIVDNIGRKFLLYTGIILMTITLIILLIIFYIYSSDIDNDDDDDYPPKYIQWIIVISFYIYIFGYQIGYGPISWILISEIYPLEIRGQSMSLAVQTNFFCNLVVTLIFVQEIDFFGLQGTFLIFTLFSIYALYFVFRHVPETKGLSLEEIERQLSQDN